MSSDGFAPLDEKFFYDLFVARAFVISGYTILVYEIFAIFPEEVRLIWPTRWSTIKVIYLIVRYGNLIFLTLGVLQNMGEWWSNDPMFCYESTLAITLIQLGSFSLLHGLSLLVLVALAAHLTVFCLFATTVLLLLRAWATWGRHLKALIVLIALFVLYAAATAGIGTWAVVSAGPDSYPDSDVTKTCLTPDGPLAWLVWLPSPILECAIFILTMFSLRQYHFDYSIERHNPIVRIIARDGMIYFTVSIINSLYNILVGVYLGNGPLDMLASTFTLCVLISANVRLVLDLRQISTTDDLSTTRVGREVDRAIRAIPLTLARSRPRSPMVFSDGDESEWPTSSDSAGEPGPSSPRSADVESGVRWGKGKGKGRMASETFELGTLDTFSEGTEARTTRRDYH